MVKSPKKTGKNEIELSPDAWALFERAIDVCGEKPAAASHKEIECKKETSQKANLAPS